MERFDLSRRAFVAGAGAGVAALAGPELADAAATPAVTPAASAPPSAPGTFDTVPFTFDVAGFTAVLNQPFPHRQLVSATSYATASDALAFMNNTLRAYADPRGFNAGPKSVHAAAVLYHGTSCFLALDDSMYAKYPIHSIIAGHDGSTAAPNVNAGGADYRELVEKHGASFFVCNNALSGLAGLIAKKTADPGTAVTRDQVIAIHDDLAAHFLPGTLLVPAGVAAINAAQEAKFTYLVA
jgi:intracellular sulfur oxidation DsrE/DsrF family protein